MSRKKLSMSEKIRRYMAAHPNAQPSDIARALGAPIKLVYAVRYAKKKPAQDNVVISAEPKAKEPVAPVFSAVDIVNRPPHYTVGGIEVIDYLQAKLSPEEFVGYLKGNVLKYGSRLGRKDVPTVDAGKLIWYANKLKAVLDTTP